MKYAPLQEHLESQPRSERLITLAFSEIEQIIGAKLPKSAYTYSEWWANQEYGSQASSWMNAHFRVERIDIAGRKVMFSRSVTSCSEPLQKSAQSLGPKVIPDSSARGSDSSVQLLFNAGFKDTAVWVLNN